MNAELTPAQSRVLDFIALHIVQRQRPPTRQTITQHFGWKSVNAAEDFVQALERKGYISLEGSDSGGHWQRYPRVIRWPASVLPILQLADKPQTVEA